MVKLFVIFYYIVTYVPMQVDNSWIFSLPRFYLCLLVDEIHLWSTFKFDVCCHFENTGFI